MTHMTVRANRPNVALNIKRIDASMSYHVLTGPAAGRRGTLTADQFHSQSLHGLLLATDDYVYTVGRAVARDQNTRSGVLISNVVEHVEMRTFGTMPVLYIRLSPDADGKSRARFNEEIDIPITTIIE